MLKLTADRRRLIWAAVITAAVWIVGFGVYFNLNREYVVIAGEDEPFTVTGSEWIVGGLAFLATFATVFVVLWGAASLRDKQKSRQRVG